MPEKNTPPELKKITPESSPKTYPAWFGFARREFTPRGSLKLRLNYGRIVVLLALMTVFAWTGKTLALFYFFRDVRNFEDVSLVDTFLFPFNRAAVRIGQGDYQIEQALAAIEREEFRQAYLLLREGVARSPGNMRGREVLAQIYMGWRADLAVDLLVEGLDKGEPTNDYLRLLFALLLQQREDDKILEIGDRLLREGKLTEEMQQIVHAFRMQSALLTGRYDILRAAYDQTGMERTIDGVLIGTQFFRKIGQWEKAAAILAAVLNAQTGEKSPQIYAQLIETLKEGGALAKAREIALELTIRNAMDWRPRIRLIDLLSASEMTERRDREIRSLLQEHRNDEQAMLALAQLVADYGNVWAASRLYELALENGYNLGVFSLSLAEAMIRAGQYPQAIELCNELAQEDPSWLVNVASSFNAIRSLAYYGAGNLELGALYLNNFLATRGTNLSQLYRAAITFRKMNLDPQALEILEEAYRRDNRNELILAALIELEMDLGAFFSVAEHLRNLFELRRPDYRILERVLEQLQGDRFLFTAARDELIASLNRIVQERFEVDMDLWRANGETS